MPGHNLYSFPQSLLPGRQEGLSPSGMEPTGKGCPSPSPSCPGPTLLARVQPQVPRPQAPASIHPSLNPYLLPSTMKPAPCQVLRPAANSTGLVLCPRDLSGRETDNTQVEKHLRSFQTEKGYETIK